MRSTGQLYFRSTQLMIASSVMQRSTQMTIRGRTILPRLCARWMKLRSIALVISKSGPAQLLPGLDR